MHVEHASLNTACMIKCKVYNIKDYIPSEPSMLVVAPPMAWPT